MADASTVLMEIRDMVAMLVKHEAEAEMKPEQEIEMDAKQPEGESFMADEADAFKDYNTEQRRDGGKRLGAS